jgi:hypothetical protein
LSTQGQHPGSACILCANGKGLVGLCPPALNQDEQYDDSASAGNQSNNRCVIHGILPSLNF